MCTTAFEPVIQADFTTQRTVEMVGPSLTIPLIRLTKIKGALVLGIDNISYQPTIYGPLSVSGAQSQKFDIGYLECGREAQFLENRKQIHELSGGEANKLNVSPTNSNKIVIKVKTNSSV